MRFIRTIVREGMDPEGKKRYFFVIYTALFLVVCLLCFWPFLSTGTSFVWYYDGWRQHLKALVYYSEYLRELFSNLFRLHMAGVPDWDFAIGEGSDIINTLHYYVIGDPFAFFCVFVPKSLMAHFLTFSCILRLYFSGIAFLALCFDAGHKNRYGLLTGSVSYAFCMWATLCAARHPFFLNPMIYFPLMVLGVEKILKKKSPCLFMLTVMISALSNFYFFYIIVVLIAIYIPVRLIMLYRKDAKNGLFMLGKLALYSVIGTCMGAILFLPMFRMVTSDTRMSASQPFHLFYSWAYYSSLPSILSTENVNYWLCIGLSAPAFLAVFLFFSKRKENIFKKTLFVICIVMMLFPIFGRILNGMAYTTNRWVWAFVLLCAFILSEKWEELLKVGKKQAGILFLCILVYFGIVLLWDNSRTLGCLSELVLYFAILIVIREVSSEKRKQLAVLLLGVVSVTLVSYYKISLHQTAYVDECLRYDQIEEKWENEESIPLEELAEEDFLRASGRGVAHNAYILRDIPSTDYYWTLSNPYQNRFRDDLAMREPLLQCYEGYDDRTTLMALSAVNYYVLNENSPKVFPYGYELLYEGNMDSRRETAREELLTELGTAELTEAQAEKLEKSTTSELRIYRNLYELPVAYCYDSYIPENVWESYDAVQKQEAMLEAVYVAGKPSVVSASEKEVPDYSKAFSIEPGNTEINVFEDRIVTTATNTKVTLTLEEPAEGSEIYVEFDGLGYESTTEYRLYGDDESVDPQNLYNQANYKLLSTKNRFKVIDEVFKRDMIDSSGTITVSLSGGGSKKIDYKQPDGVHSNGRDHFIVDLGYYEDAKEKITLTFAGRGVYTFDSLKVYVISMDGFAEKIEALKKDPVREITFGTDLAEMKTSADHDTILCFATPFSKGWEATVDGKEAEVLCVNERYPGLEVPKGEHKIRFRYHLPLKKEGAAVSLFGTLAFAGVITVRSLRRRKHEIGK